jgi:hypothetical protein
MQNKYEIRMLCRTLTSNIYNLYAATYFQCDTVQIYVLTYNKINNIVSALLDGSYIFSI